MMNHADEDFDNVLIDVLNSLCLRRTLQFDKHVIEVFTCEH